IGRFAAVGGLATVPVGVCATGVVSDVRAVDVPVAGTGDASWVGSDVAVPVGVCATNTGVDVEGADGASTVGTIGDADWLLGEAVARARPRSVGCAGAVKWGFGLSSASGGRELSPRGNRTGHVSPGIGTPPSSDNRVTASKSTGSAVNPRTVIPVALTRCPVASTKTGVTAGFITHKPARWQRFI